MFCLLAFLDGIIMETVSPLPIISFPFYTYPSHLWLQWQPNSSPCKGRDCIRTFLKHTETLRFHLEPSGIRNYIDETRQKEIIHKNSKIFQLQDIKILRFPT